MNQGPWAGMTLGVESAMAKEIIVLGKAVIEIIGLADVDFSLRVDNDVNVE